MKDSDSKFAVQFRYIGCPTEAGEFGCIGLFYKKQSSANAAVENLQSYFKASPAKKISNVKAMTAKSGTISLVIDYSWGGTDDDSGNKFTAEIDGIDPGDFEKVVKTLRVFTAFGILIGYESKDGPQIIPPAELSIFRAGLYFDGEAISATGHNSPPKLY